MNNLDSYINNLKKELSNETGLIFGNDGNIELIYLYGYYHYFNANPSSLDELSNGIVYEQDALDHIGAIFIDSESDNNDVDIIVPYYTDEDIEFPGIIKYFKDAEAAVFDSKNSKGIYRKKLDDLLKQDEYQISSLVPLKIKVVTNYNPQSVSKRKMINNTLNSLKPEHKNVTYQIQFGADIEYDVLEIESPKDNVTKAYISIDNSENLIVHGNEKSIVVNISAKSLKDLYEMYGYRGLFSQNLRYYVKNSKVDDNIINTIENHPENFWYFNNGIIIVCDDYEVEGSKVLLTNFSIVNGGQTTKLIGESQINDDFYIICKIVKNRYEDEEDRIEFIANVAEASNTQKPIKGKDLIANRIEQRQLKKQLSEIGVYCQIKRGEKINKRIYPDPWQNTTNEEIGQLLLSFLYQKPGTARSNKASICDNEERYELLFGKKYNSEFIVNLLKIRAYYKKWAQYSKKNDDGIDSFRLGLINNGMLFTMSIIGAICKIYYHDDYLQIINETVNNDNKMQIISQYDISHPILKDSLTQKDFFDFFEYCYEKFYRSGYEFLKAFKPNYSNYSNFTKVNTNYNMYIFRQICYEYKNGICEEDKTMLSRMLYCASQEELNSDKELLKKYVNLISAQLDRTPIESSQVIDRIKNELVKYRTKTYKTKRIKPYEVFKNISADVISKYAPTTLDDLKDLQCLDEAQIEMFGGDIVSIVCSIIEKQ